MWLHEAGHAQHEAGAEDMPHVAEHVQHVLSGCQHHILQWSPSHQEPQSLHVAGKENQATLKGKACQLSFDHTKPARPCRGTILSHGSHGRAALCNGLFSALLTSFV